MLDPRTVCFFVPPELKKFKLDLFNRVGDNIQKLGGRVVRGDHAALDHLTDDVVPIVGCSPQLTPMISRWRMTGRRWCYWDRSYVRRVFATCLPTGEDGGFYRFHLNSFQMQTIRDVPDDRWRSMRQEVSPWKKGGRHIVIAAPTETYCRFHGCEDWIAKTLRSLALLTDRQIVIRDKEQYKRRPIQMDIEGAHALVTHASNAAVESVILGCPVFVHPDSAAALVGQTDLSKIENPIYPDREPWLWSLAYSQFNQREMTDGTLWKLLQ